MGLFSSPTPHPAKPAPDRLSSAELSALERCTAIVDDFVRSQYPRVGAALAEIRDKRLYRQTHETFALFCTERWKMGENYANRLILAAGVATNLMPTGTIPQTERMARPLGSLPANEQIAAWSEAKDEAGIDPVRPEHVERAVAKRKKKPSKKRPKPVRIRVPGGIVVIEPGRGFTSVEACLHDALAKLTTQRSAA